MDDRKAQADGLDPEVRTEVNRILAMDPNDMSLYEKEFLRARADYIKEKHKERLADIFNPKQAKKDKKAKADEDAAKAEEVAAANEEASKDPYTPEEPETPEDDDSDDGEDEDEEPQG